MKIEKQLAILKIVNKSCLEKEYPSYDHIEIGSKRHILKEPVSYPPKSSTEPYLEYNVEVSGTLADDLGYLPNPMVKVPTIKVDKINFKD